MPFGIRAPVGSPSPKPAVAPKSSLPARAAGTSSSAATAPPKNARVTTAPRDTFQRAVGRATTGTASKNTLAAPVTTSKPSGADWLPKLSNFSAGVGDTLSFGLTSFVRRQIGVDDVVNRKSVTYAAGEVAGVGLSVATGAAGALRYGSSAALGMGMARPNAAFPRGIEWVERSHFIPKRWLPQSLQKASWNLKRMWGTDHALADPMRLRLLKRPWKSTMEPLDPVRRVWARLPNWMQGAGGGGAYGGSSVATRGK